MGAYNFELMERKGYKTHYRGLVTADGRQIRLEDIDTLGGVMPNTMEIDLTNVIKPDQRIAYDGSLAYSYSKYHDLFEKGTTYQIPTENMHRFYLPRSSSIFTRLNKKEIQLEDFSWVKSPVPGQRLDPPIVDFSSKYEDGDRYVSRQEAYTMTGLSQRLFTSFTENILKIGKLFSDRAEKVGMLYLDGKLEAYCYEKGYVWSDVCGTQDEGKFEFMGVSTDKEVFREPYRILQPEWVEDVEGAKYEARARGVSNWKSLCRFEPRNLSEELLQIGSQMYTATTNIYIGKKVFDVPSLVDVVKQYREWLNAHPRH
jgi:phosphoribosylaminoimidazole-succinocarboxamide synthase